MFSWQSLAFSATTYASAGFVHECTLCVYAISGSVSCEYIDSGFIEPVRARVAASGVAQPGEGDLVVSAHEVMDDAKFDGSVE